MLAPAVDGEQQLLQFMEALTWLAGILGRGMRRGEITLAPPDTKTARLVLSALQGALLVKRTTGDMAQLRDVVAVLKAELTPPVTR